MNSELPGTLSNLMPSDPVPAYEETGALLKSLDRCIEETRTVLGRNPAFPSVTREEILSRINRLRQLAQGRLAFGVPVKSPALLKTSLDMH